MYIPGQLPLDQSLRVTTSISNLALNHATRDDIKRRVQAEHARALAERIVVDRTEEIDGDYETRFTTQVYVLSAEQLGKLFYEWYRKMPYPSEVTLLGEQRSYG